MTTPACRFATEAERLAGAPFRLHGRDPETGIDCVGLVAVALREAGVSARPPAGYALRNIDCEAMFGSAILSGFAPVAGSVLRGDLLAVRPGPAQCHLIVALGRDRFIHAHAGLRRAIIQTGLGGWPIWRHWRLLQS